MVCRVWSAPAGGRRGGPCSGVGSGRIRLPVGLCTEFGPQIRHDCSEPMVADTACCFCPTCEAVCTGKFPACSKVWARGPQAVPLRAKALGPPAALSLTANSHGHRRSSVNGSATNGSHETDAVSHLLPCSKRSDSSVGRSSTRTPLRAQPVRGRISRRTSPPPTPCWKRCRTGSRPPSKRRSPSNTG
jgi:hypothetical protein